MESTKKLNFFPAANGISPYYSPRMIIHHETLDYNKHCLIPFGSYVQAHNEPEPFNSQLPRRLDCIYLRYMNNKQGGHALLDLRTGSIIHRRVVTQVPMGRDVIDLVHAMADHDNMPSGLKITTQSGIILHDNTSIVGVNDANTDADAVNETKDDMYDDMEIEADDDNDELDPNEIGNIVSEIHPYNSKQHEENHDDGQDDEEYPTNETDDASNESVSSQDDEDNNQATQTYKTTRYGRVSNPPVKLSFSQYNIPTQG
jgi:hypothetical protein